MDSTGGRRFRWRLFFIIPGRRLGEQRLRLLDVLVQVLGLASIVTIKPTNCQEARKVMAFADQE